MQVTAKTGDASARAQLSDRFQQAIDAAAMKAGLAEMQEYLAEWRQDTRPCGDELESEVAAEVARLEGIYDSALLRQLTRSGGVREAEPD